MKIGLKSPLRERSHPFGETALKGTIGNTWIAISFSLLQFDLVIGEAAVL